MRVFDPAKVFGPHYIQQTIFADRFFVGLYIILCWRVTVTSQCIVGNDHTNTQYL